MRDRCASVPRPTVRSAARLAGLVAACVGLVVSAAQPAPAAGAEQPAGERILSYHVEITVHADAWITVQETIEVLAEGNEIKRGIYRDVPVTYGGGGPFGGSGFWGGVRVPIEIVSVKRDGRPEPYHTEDVGRHKRIYAGKSDVFLQPGVYTYSLTYRLGRMIGYFDDHDELYFNVTGNEWAFPIGEASATVILPEDVPDARVGHEAYTGPAGAKGQDYESEMAEDGTVAFRTTRPLAAGEGLTIVVTWPKGFVPEPTRWERLTWLSGDVPVLVIGPIGLVVVFAYYVLAWWRVGRDPARGTVIPLYEPPEGVSPPAARFILEMGYDTKCMAAALVDLAVRGFLKIEDTDGEFRLVRRDLDDEPRLPSEERKVLRRLLGSGTRSLTLENKHHSRFSGAADRLKDTLKSRFSPRHFVSNTPYAVAGAVLSAGTMIAIGLGLGMPRLMIFAFLSVWLTGWSFGVWKLVGSALSGWRQVIHRRGGWQAAGSAVFLTAFSVPFLAGEVFAIGVMASLASIWIVPLAVALIAVNLVFLHWLKAPTRKGRELMDRLEGFRMYLSTAEQRRLEAAHPPEKTPELFERYLPYAMAMDVENAWAEQFADVLEAAEAERAEGRGYSPSWYSGPAVAGAGLAGLTSGLGSSLSSAFSSAATAPGSTSGSGGGGSSGGGGGGGGGGGW